MEVSNIIPASLLADPLSQNQRINHKYEYEYKINICHGCTLPPSLAGLAEECSAWA